MKKVKNPVLLRACLAGIIVFFTFHLHAQWKVTHFEGYFNFIDHRAVVFNSSKTCDSLGLKDYQGKKPDADLLVCYEQEYSESDLLIHDRNGVAVFVDSTGALYSKDNYAPKASPYYLNLNIHQLLKGRKDIVVEADDSDYDSLVIRAIPLSEYRLGRINKKGATQIALYYDNFTYPAKGELAPAVLNQLYDGIKMFPEDGKVEDKITIYIPMEVVNVPGSFSLYIYDLQGNILRMYTDLDKNENVLYRENLISGTYRYAIFFDSGKIEVKKGMLNFKAIPRPE